MHSVSQMRQSGLWENCLKHMYIQGATTRDKKNLILDYYILFNDLIWGDSGICEGGVKLGMFLMSIGLEIMSNDVLEVDLW